MAKCKLCIAARGVLQDAQSNNISLFNIIERVNILSFPFFMQEMGVLGVWSKEEGDRDENDAEFIIKNNDKQLLKQKLQIHFREADLFRSIVRMGGIVITEPGVLEFSFLQNGEIKNSYKIEVISKQQTTLKESPSSD